MIDVFTKELNGSVDYLLEVKFSQASIKKMFSSKFSCPDFLHYYSLFYLGYFWVCWRYQSHRLSPTYLSLLQESLADPFL